MIDPVDEQRIVDYALRLRHKRRELRTDPKWSASLERWSGKQGRTLVIDDFTDIALFKSTSLYMQERARLRANRDDYVVTTTAADPAFDNYVADDLGLGPVTWWTVTPPAGSIRLAQSCWLDREARSKLVRAMRQDDLKYVHPHISNRDVWQLASLLSQTAHLPLTVIAPPPGISRWANDKSEFARAVIDLLGAEYLPHTESAWNFATLSFLVRKLAADGTRLALKLPHASGGTGNLCLEAESLRNKTLKQIDALVRERVARLAWTGNGPLLINVWESSVLDSASIQTWIPPLGTGQPVFEGIFSQLIQANSGSFMGCKPLQLPPHIERIVLRATSLLTRLFQQLHYMGRCSFDFLLVGTTMDDCRVQFIECNARWGGTSVPMTLMNRVFRDWTYQPFSAVETQVSDRNVPFAWVLERLAAEVYTVHRPGGWLIPYNPGRIAMRGGLNWIVLGESAEQVAERSGVVLPALLKSRLAAHAHVGS